MITWPSERSDTSVTLRLPPSSFFPSFLHLHDTDDVSDIESHITNSSGVISVATEPSSVLEQEMELKSTYSKVE